MLKIMRKKYKDFPTNIIIYLVFQSYKRIKKD